MSLGLARVCSTSLNPSLRTSTPLNQNLPPFLRNLRGARHAERVQSAWKTAAGCDVVLFVVDARRQLAAPDPRVLRAASDIGTKIEDSEKAGSPPFALVLNKADAVPREDRPRLLKLAEEFQRLAAFDDVFYVSALKGKNDT